MFVFLQNPQRTPDVIEMETYDIEITPSVYKPIRIISETPAPLPPIRGFLKNVSSNDRVKPWLFVTFNII